MAFKLDGYVTVNERLGMALELWPELRVCESPPKVVQVGDSTFIEVTITVWRDPEDTIPCSAAAWEPIPGKTPYTRDSEMMNASTSALGRALGLMGIGTAGSISTADEVINRQYDREMAGHDIKRTKAGEAPRSPSKPPEPDSAPTSGQKRQKPTDKMLGFLSVLEKRKGTTASPEAREDFDACRSEIDRLQELPDA
jgi:hypothetical protein